MKAKCAAIIVLPFHSATPLMPPRANTRARVPERQSVSECRKYATHHIFVPYIPDIWCIPQLFFPLQRQIDINFE
jgi:hypothetical protein